MNDMKPLSYRQETQVASGADNVFPYTSIDAPAPPPIDTNRMLQLEDMLKEVQGRAEIVEKEAYEKAYLAGEKAGLALGRKRGEQILEALEETIQEAEASLTNIHQSFAEAAIDVAKHVAESIVADLIATDLTKLLDIAHQAAAQLPDHSGLRIAVSPDDFSSFNRLFDDEEKEADKMTMSSLYRDASVVSGTCRVISSKQDILIDPVAAVTSYISNLHPGLLKPLSSSHHDAQS